LRNRNDSISGDEWAFKVTAILLNFGIYIFRWRVDRADIMLPTHKIPVTFYKHPEAEYVEDIKFEEKDFQQ
jgi:hypothetical protein